MIPDDILKMIRRIDIRTRHMVNDVLGGQYESVFKGQGMEFEEVREYQPGDEIRSIDWNVTARMGRPFLKKYVEERELTVMLLLDASASTTFGSVKRRKGELSAELCAVIAFSAIKNNDKVGLIIFTDRIEKYVPPQKGRRHVLRVISEALSFEPDGRGTDIAAALEYLNRVTIRRTVAFLISDFLAADYERPLQIANRRHDVIALTITDPRELELPNVGILELEDAETGEKIQIDTQVRRVREAFQRLASEKAQQKSRILRSANVDTIDVFTDKPYIEPLLKFFRMRERRH
ncbi:MAG: DUF58 domain-containing protein [Candidatus Poribacteria bacterium]|nr:DUF58 domain-containing protein [Candidatus Poribacteria bacterium]